MSACVCIYFTKTTSKNIMPYIYPYVHTNSMVTGGYMSASVCICLTTRNYVQQETWDNNWKPLQCCCHGNQAPTRVVLFGDLGRR